MSARKGVAALKEDEIFSLAEQRNSTVETDILNGGEYVRHVRSSAISAGSDQALAILQRRRDPAD